VLRLSCDNCGKPLLLKLTQRELRVGTAATSDRAETTRQAEKSATAETTSAAPTDSGSTNWELVVNEFPEESLSALRAVLSQVPRYSRNPNKLFDITAELPYRFGDLSFEQLSRLEACLADCRGSFERRPEGRTTPNEGT
jgi:hypothetical protein